MKNLLISLKDALSNQKNHAFLVSIGVLSFAILFPFVAVSQNLTAVQGQLNAQAAIISQIVKVIIGIVFMIGVIHVAIVFSQGQQNAKDIALKYFAGIMIFSVIWLIIPGNS